MPQNLRQPRRRGPIANLVVGALVRFLQATPRVGFVHHRGCREFVLGYADDLCLLANSTEGMEALLAQVERFCDRTGLELNVDKTVVQGIDYSTEQDLRPQVSYGGRRVPCLPARTPFKYLGCLGNMTFTFQGERARILKRTREAAALIEGRRTRPEDVNPARWHSRCLGPQSCRH